MDIQSTKYVPATTGKARAFVIPCGARYGRDIHYTSFMSVDTSTESLGDITPIRINDPNRYGSYLDVGQIRGSRERPTTSLIQKMPMEIISIIDRLSHQRIDFDVHIQYGDCYDPRDIRQFSKGIVYEFATGTSKDRDALIALDDTEDAEIRETLAISAEKTYTYVPLGYQDKATETVINEITAVAIKNSRDCEDEDCSTLPMFAVTKTQGGSPGTGPYVLWSLDDGGTWDSHEIDTLADDEDAIGIDIINGYIVVISEDAGSFSFVEIDEFYYPDQVGFDPDFTESTTGLLDNPKAIVSAGIDGFICGDGGYVYKISEPSEGVTVLDEAQASGANQLNAIDAFDNLNIVAVGNNSTIVYSTDGASFSAVTTKPKGVGINATAVGMRYADEWWIGFDDGTVFVTFDFGKHWSEVSLPGQASITKINDIAWSSHSVGYIAATYSGNGRIYRTICGGIKWSVEPQQSRYSMPAVDNFNGIAISKEDVNIVLAGGLGDNATDGALVVGKDLAV